MNKERMLQLADFIETVPEESFNMDCFFSGGSVRDLPPLPGQMPHDCGTAACVAGYALMLFGTPDEINAVRRTAFAIDGGGRGLADLQGKIVTTTDTAQTILGLTREESHRLFLGHFSSKGLTQITRADAVAEIRRMAGAIE